MAQNKPVIRCWSSQNRAVASMSVVNQGLYCFGYTVLKGYIQGSAPDKKG